MQIVLSNKEILVAIQHYLSVTRGLDIGHIRLKAEGVWLGPHEAAFTATCTLREDCDG